MPKVNGILISYCGIICEYCPAYRKKLCPGCDAHANECEYIKCLNKRGVNNCLLCTDFPCKLHENGFKWTTEEYGELTWKVYSNIFIELMKRIKSSK